MPTLSLGAFTTQANEVPDLTVYDFEPSHTRFEGSESLLIFSIRIKSPNIDLGNHMLVIRRQQQESILREMQRELVMRIARDLKVHYPEIVGNLPTSELERRVEIGVQGAGKYELSRECDLADFVSFMFLVAPNFDQYPSINELLSDPDIPPDHRIEKMLRHTTEAQWLEAKADWDGEIWR